MKIQVFIKKSLKKKFNNKAKNYFFKKIVDVTLESPQIRNLQESVNSKKATNKDLFVRLKIIALTSECLCQSRSLQLCDYKWPKISTNWS